VSSNLGNRGSVRIDGVYRKAGRFYSLRTDTTTGQVSDSLGNEYDLGYVEKKCADDVMAHFATSPGAVIKESPADVSPFPALMQANTPRPCGCCRR
jgi:hypothetical protein